MKANLPLLSWSVRARAMSGRSTTSARATFRDWNGGRTAAFRPTRAGRWIPTIWSRRPWRVSRTAFGPSNLTTKGPFRPTSGRPCSTGCAIRSATPAGGRRRISIRQSVVRSLAARGGHRPGSAGALRSRARAPEAGGSQRHHPARGAGVSHRRGGRSARQAEPCRRSDGRHARARPARRGNVAGEPAAHVSEYVVAARCQRAVAEWPRPNHDDRARRLC